MVHYLQGGTLFKWCSNTYSVLQNLQGSVLLTGWYITYRMVHYFNGVAILIVCYIITGEYRVLHYIQGANLFTGCFIRYIQVAILFTGEYRVLHYI